MKILGIDYGKSKVGLAIGEAGLAEPFLVLKQQNTINGILKIIKENNIDKVVIGLTGGKIDEEIRKFGDEIKIKTNLPVIYSDETLSTQDAQRVLIELGKSRKRRREIEDAVAAAIMLQCFIEGGDHD